MKLKADILLEVLLSRIRANTPQKTNMASMLSDILCIGKEAVYRRLRGEVPFSFHEVAILSERLGFSLDNIVGGSDPNHILLHLDSMRFESAREIDHGLYLRSIELLEQITSDPLAKMGCSANMIPISFLLKYRSLTEFKVFKWMYQYDPVEKLKPLHEMNYPAESQQYCNELLLLHREIGQSYYILDSHAFAYFINDVKYFAEVNLVRREDVERIKADLYLLLDEMEEVATKGKFETGKNVQLYICNLNLEATYSYYESSSLAFGVIKFFSLNSIAGSDKWFFEKMTNWIDSLKRLSVLISESGEVHRVRFFNQQRELVDTL